MGRKRIGIIYQPTSNWIAGAYYVQNIISALNLCADSDKPTILVYSSSKNAFEELQQLTCYPYLIYRNYSGEESVFQNFVRRFIKKTVGFNFEFHKPPFIGDRVRFVYPVQTLSDLRSAKYALGWIPDFQDKRVPEFFSTVELDGRAKWHQSFVQAKVPIVFSSQDALKDFRTYYPEGNDLEGFVLPFAVTHPDYTNEDIDGLKKKFGISKPYLFCANQFWIHKNHKFLFEAFVEAKKCGFDFQLVCSGKMGDYRNPEYAKEIMDFIDQNGLKSDIKLLGFIDRTEQLCLMKNAYAMIQPSLFEGWSTVVEDAKCLNQFIFLSDIPVHREQNPKNVCFFDPRDKQDLINKLLKTKIYIQPYDYSENKCAFGNIFVDIIEHYYDS